MEVLELKCASCGAVVTGSEISCKYCSAALFDVDGKRLAAAKELKDFGWNSILLLILTPVIGIVILLFGWKFGDQRAFQTNTLLCWHLLLPLWIFVMAVIWRTNQNFTFLIGFGFAILIFIVHAYKINAISGGQYFDDTMGDAAFVAVPVFFSWMIGRIMHRGIRKRLQ